MSTQDLLPCPFCGGEAENRSYHSCDCCGKPYNGRILCKLCGAEVSHFDTDGEAIAAWNRRSSPPAAVPDAVAAIKFALTIDDHFDRLEFLYAFVDGSANTDEEWDDWQEFARAAAPAAPTEASDE